MSAASTTSSFEALPPEIFNQILGYLFDPAACEVRQTATTFRGYRFETTILCTSKAIHDLAKSHLHHSLSWIRFDINWDAFLIDPHWQGVPYITIDRKDTPKAIPYPYAGDSTRRSPKQQTPKGRIAVRIKFPTPTTSEQKDIRSVCFNGPFASFTSILVLEKDLGGFMRALRMNDLAYCHRVLPDIGVSTKSLDTHSDRGISFAIRIPPGQELKRYENLVDKFRRQQGPFHELCITGHEDKAAALAVTMTAAQRWPGENRRQSILDAKPLTYVEGIKLVMYLKLRGDLYLQDARYDMAYMCYDQAILFEHYWSAHDPQPSTESFWEEGSNVYKAFGIALACNLAMAHVAGALAADVRGLRERTTLGYALDLMDMSISGVLLGDERYLELLFMMTVHHLRCQFFMPNAFDGNGANNLCAYLSIMISAWDARHNAKCCHEDSSMTGKVYGCAKSLLAFVKEEFIPAQPVPEPTNDNDTTPTFTSVLKKLADAKKVADEKTARAARIRKRLSHMRSMLKGATFEPLKWAIHEDLISERLRDQLTFLPSIHMATATLNEESEWDLVPPSFDRFNKEAFDRGDEGRRLLI